MSTAKEKLTLLADAMRTRMARTDKLTLDEMTEIAQRPTFIAKFLEDGSQIMSCTPLLALSAEDTYGVTKIKGERFAGKECCFEAITFSDTLKTIETSAFNGCKNLKYVYLPSSVTSLSSTIFTGSSLNAIEIHCDIASEVCYECKSLKTVYIGKEVRSISGATFMKCSALTNVTLEEGINTIGGYVFNGCTSLTSITIPASVETMLNGAMLIGSGTLKASIKMKGATPPTIEAQTFNASAISKITVPAGSGDTYRQAQIWSNFADLIVEE